MVVLADMRVQVPLMSGRDAGDDNSDDNDGSDDGDNEDDPKEESDGDKTQEKGVVREGQIDWKAKNQVKSA